MFPRALRPLHLIAGRVPAVALAWLVLALLASPSPASETGPERVVVLHGLARGAGSMQTLAEGLRDRGFEPHNLDYPSTRQTPEELLKTIAAAVERCCAGESGRTHFVGHSLGAILIRALLAEDPPPTLGRVVLLAPPNRGSEIVDTFGEYAIFEAILGPTAVELGTDEGSLPNNLPAPDYELGIIAGNQSLSPIGSVLLPGDDDGTVRIEATRVEGARDFLVVEATHTFIMSEPEVIRQVVHFLKVGMFDHTGEALQNEENPDVAQ